MLERTQRLLETTPGAIEPRKELIEVLHAVIELLALPENNFTWSSWESRAEAVREVQSLLSRVEVGILPERLDVSVLFAPTGPLQEVSLSSGWNQVFLKLSARFDSLERQLWE